ncbi:prepilin-type N-terminal cleavage/methylation domain-containing protein [Planctomycetota bacterium]
MRVVKQKAFTLVEILAAVLILAVVIVPMLKYQADSLATNLQMERQIKSVLFAEKEMEKIKTALHSAFETDVTAWPNELKEKYLVQRVVTEQGETLKVVTVSVGYDADDNGTLASGEVMVSLDSQMVKRN